MNVLVVDDEPLAREWLIRLLGRMSDVRVAGEASSGDEALAKASAMRPDVVLLDIHIPGADGLEVARRLDGCAVVFTTAHGQYAIAAFELDACDYLVKPIGYAQLARSVARARRRRTLQAVASSDAADDDTANTGSNLVVHERGRVQVFDARRVTRFRAADKYTMFCIDGDEYLVRDSLDQLEHRLAPNGFVRVHRAELVRGDACVALVREPGGAGGAGGAALELSDGQRVAVSRRYLAAARRILDR